MTFPPQCPMCGGRLTWWDDTEDARCLNCGAEIDHLESLNLLERRNIERILEIDTASRVKPKEEVL